MKKKIKIYKWQIEVSVSLRRDASILRQAQDRRKKISVQPVSGMTVAEKFNYALKLYNMMWYHPMFKDMQHVLEALRDAAVELGRVYEMERGRSYWSGMVKKREQAVDKIIDELHRYVESIAEKEEGFVLGLGMVPKRVKS